jgi:putative flippase GtrA
MKSPDDRKPWSLWFIEREPVRYVLVGGLNTVIYYAAYLVLLPLVGYAIAYTVIYVGGVFLAYYLNARLVFRRPLQWRQAIQYPLVFVLQYGLGITLTTALIEGLHLNAKYVPALVIVMTLPFTFWLTRWIIKREGKTGFAPDPSPNPEGGADTSVCGK